jgi:hypothetical protein
MDVPGISRPVLIVLVVAALLLLAGGGTKAVGLITEHTDTSTRVLPAAPSIAIDVRTGDVRVVATGRRDVRLTTKEKRSVWGGGHAEIAGAGARLHLGDRCSKVPLVDATCSVSYVLEVPRDTTVHMVAGTGDLRAENLHGDADLRAGTGDLHVIGVTGTLRLQTATGDVHVESPSSNIAVRTATGDVEVTAYDPTSVDAESNTGDVVLSVPAQSYDVDARSETGDDIVDVDRDEASPRRLRAHTQTGDLVVSAGLPVS